MRRVLFSLVVFMLSVLLFGCLGGGGGESSTSTTSTSSTTTSTTTLAGQASVSVLVDSTSTTRRINRASTSEGLGKAILIVDTNQDGIFDPDSGDQKYETIITSDGKVDFKDVKVPETGEIKAKLRIEKIGRAPYEKVLDLSKDAKVTIKVDTTPVNKQTVQVNATLPQINLNSTVKRGSPIYLVFTLRKNGVSGRKIEVRTTTRRDLRVDSSVELQAVIPSDLIPSSVTTITSAMKRFSGVSDRDYFPGQFVGIGAPSRYRKRDGSNEYKLKSVTFSLIRLEDQNGKPIQFQNKRDNETIGIDITVPDDAVGQICEDADPNQPGLQVPFYRYDYESGAWIYVGTGTLYSFSDNNPVNETLVNGTNCLSGTGYYARVEVPASDWSEYWNIDYPVWFGSEPKTYNVCIKLRDQQTGKPLSWADVWTEGGDTGYYEWTDQDGIVKIQMLVPAANASSSQDALSYILNKYDFYYDYWSYGITQMLINDSNFQIDNTDEECDFTAVVNVPNPFDAQVNVVLIDENGNPVKGKWVDIWSENYDYWDSGVTDENGMIKFSVKSNVKYDIYALGVQKQVEVDGIKGLDEKEDNGHTVTVEFRKKNNPPQVSIWVYPDPVRTGAVTTAYVYAWDPDGDSLTLKSASWDGKQVNCNETYIGYGNGYWTCTLDTTQLTGSIYFNATVSDGENVGSASYSVTVMGNTNHPPQIFGLTIIDNSTGYPVWDWSSLKQGKAYKFEAYGWDPDGDVVTYTYKVNSPNATCSGDTCTFNAAGDYDLTVNASDGRGGTSVADYMITVKNPQDLIEIEQVWTENGTATAGGSVTVHALLYNPDEAAECYYGYYGNETYTKFKVQRSLNASAVEVYLNGNKETPINETVNDYGCGYYEYMATINLPTASQSAYYTIKVKINNKEASTNVWVEVPNNPPVFTKSLPDQLNLNVGDDYTFNVSATDPDGDAIQYTWYVKYSYLGSYEEKGMGSSFSYNFDKAGIYWVKCVASDGKGGKTETVSTVTVTSNVVPTVGSGKLILHLGLSGIYVGIHNATNMDLIEYKTTNDTGDVEFDNVPSNAYVSISFTPDVYITDKSPIIDSIKSSVFEDVKSEICGSNETCLNATCIPSSEIQESLNGTIDPTQLQLLIASYDSDHNNCLDKTELWKLLSENVIDKDKDGKITIKELDSFENDTSVYIDTTFIKLPALGEYDFTSQIKDSFEFYGEKTITVNVKDLPPNTYLNIIGPYYSTFSISNTGTTVENATSTISLWALQNDGTYSLIFTDNTNNKCYYVIDQTSDNVTLNYNDFIQTQPINVLNAENQIVLIGALYKGALYELGSSQFNSQSGTIYICNFSPAEKFYVELYPSSYTSIISNVTSNLTSTYNNTTIYNETIYNTTYDNTTYYNTTYYNDTTYYNATTLVKSTNYLVPSYQEVFVTYDSLPSTIDLNSTEFKPLDIAVTTPDNATYDMSGNDLSKVNLWYYWDWEEGNYTAGEVYFDLAIFNVNSTVPTQWTKADYKKVLPSEVQAYLNNATLTSMEQGLTFVSVEGDPLTWLLQWYPAISYKEVGFELYSAYRRSNNLKKKAKVRILVPKISIKAVVKKLFK